MVPHIVRRANSVGAAERATTSPVRLLSWEMEDDDSAYLHIFARDRYRYLLIDLNVLQGAEVEGHEDLILLLQQLDSSLWEAEWCYGRLNLGDVDSEMVCIPLVSQDTELRVILCIEEY